MEGSTGPVAPRRTLTPAIIASSLFTVACAALAITFVATRGGLQLPTAPAGSHAAVASPAASAVPSAAPSATAVAGPPGPTDVAASAPPTPTVPTEAPAASPTATPAPTPAASQGLLEALPGCPGIPGCYEYTVRRNDTLSGVASRYLIPVSVVLALNPEVRDPSTILVGQTLYLGRDPFLRLQPCPDQPDCSLYEVRAGDGLSTIAGRFGLTLEAILAANPEITDVNAIRTGELIRLPHPAA